MQNKRKPTGLQVSLSGSSKKVVKISEIEQIDLKSGDYILPVDRSSKRNSLKRLRDLVPLRS